MDTPTHVARGASRLIPLVTLALIAGVWSASRSEASPAQRTVPLFLPASDRDRQSFIRVINHGPTAGDVTIHAIDDGGNRRGQVVLALEAGATQHFNSDDLEFGNPDKGLTGATGGGEGYWRLQMSTDLDIEVLAYVRTADGFLTSMHSAVDAQGLCWRVPIFNPGSNTSQRSLLRVVNPNDDAVRVNISGSDDEGSPSASTVTLSLDPLASRNIYAQDLESGADGLNGSLGDGIGKWQLAVSAGGPVTVMSLLESPTGHLTNLSPAAAFGAGRCWVASDSRNVDGSVGDLLAEPIRNDASPGLIAAIIDLEGVRAIAAAGVRKAGHSQGLLTTDAVHIGSNTKAMTSVMLAALVRDSTFANGWNTTIGEVFPELLDEVHPDYHMVSLWQLVTMTGGIKRNAANWHAHRSIGLMQRRYRILRDNLAEPPAASAGEYLYSNLGYLVAGAMAEKVTGKVWETLMQERLFAPLGMSTAGFGAPGTPGQVDQPWGHRRDPDGEDWVPNQVDNAAALGPAGTVHVAIEDWAKFMALWLPEVPPAVLDRKALDELITPTSGDYAAGWIVTQRSWAGGTAIAHSGSNTSWYTTLWIAPEIGLAYVAAANSAEPDLEQTFWLLDGIISDMIRHSLGASPVSTSILDRDFHSVDD